MGVRSKLVRAASPGFRKGAQWLGPSSTAFRV